jgi:hypothetical protein
MNSIFHTLFYSSFDLYCTSPAFILISMIQLEAASAMDCQVLFAPVERIRSVSCTS